MKIKNIKISLTIAIVVLLLILAITISLSMLVFKKKQDILYLINDLRNKQTNMVKNINLLKKGANYDYLLKILEADRSQDDLYNNLVEKDFEKLFKKIADECRIDHIEVIFQESNQSFIERIDFNKYNIEITYVTLTIKIHTFLEEQLLFFIKKIENLSKKENILYNFDIKNLNIAKENSEFVNNQELQSNKILDLDLEIYFFNVINKVN